MASALRASRDFVREALARVRAGATDYERNLDRQGPEIKVEPFDAHNVSTPAALIKLGTSIAAARRHKANVQAAQQDVELAREKTRAEIAHLRAEAEYNLGRGRQGATVQTIGGGPHKGQTVGEAKFHLAEDRFGLAKTTAAERAHRADRLAKARLGLQEIDKAVARDAETGTFGQMNVYEHAISGRLGSKIPEERASALDALHINPTDYETLYPTEKAKMVQDAMSRLRAMTHARAKLNSEMHYRPYRERYQSIIDEGIQGLLDDQGDQVDEGPGPATVPDEGVDPALGV